MTFTLASMDISPEDKAFGLDVAAIQFPKMRDSNDIPLTGGLFIFFKQKDYPGFYDFLYIGFVIRLIRYLRMRREERDEE